jgi:hypothetical protein
MEFLPDGAPRFQIFSTKQKSDQLYLRYRGVSKCWTILVCIPECSKVHSLSERPGHRFELVRPESKSGAQHTS